MDKTEAVRRFCRENVAFLSSRQATDKAVRKLRIDYSVAHNLKSGERFSNTDVAHEVVELYLRTHQVSLEKFLEDATSVPIIRDNVPKMDLVLAHQSKDRHVEGIIRPSDLGKVSQEEFIRRIEGQLREQAKGRADEEIRAEQEELAKLKEQVAQERKTLERFRSDLDSILPTTPVKDLIVGLAKPPEAEPEKRPTIWWKDIGLLGDPFPTYTGLDQIPREEWDDVVVLTPFFRRYVQEANENPGMLLGKTILISGEFGSGKTTLLQYLSAAMGRHGIIPVDVNFITYDPVGSLTKEMVGKVCDSLSSLYVFRHGRDPRGEGLTRDPFALAADLFQAIQSDQGSKGFLVCVDGLHKGTLDEKPVFNFLQQLQNVQEGLSHRGINVGFIIAGSPLWDRQLEQTPSLSGSFHRRDSIPPLTEESAVEAVEKRIRTFSGNSALAPVINKQDLRRTFQILAQRIQHPLTFRDFLKHIGTRLEARQYSEAGITVTLHIETIEAVQAILRASEVGPQFDGMLTEIGSELSLRSACRAVMVGLLEKGGASEQGPLYHSYRAAFFLLRKHELITQRRSEGPTDFEWTLSRDFKNAIVNIGQRLSISARAAVSAAFEELRTTRRAESGVVYEQARITLESLIPAWKDQWPNLVEPIEKCRELLDEIDKFTQEANWRGVSDIHFTQPIETLVRSLCVVAFGETVDASDPWSLYADSWLAPENVDKLQLFSRNSFRLPTNETEFYGKVHDHNDAIAQLLRQLREYLQGENICRLSRRHLTEEEYATLNKLRQQFNQFAYKDVVDGVGELLEARIRANCFVALRVVWGDSAFDKLPVDVRTAIEKLPERGHARTRRPRDANFFFDMSRSEYAKVLSEGNISKAVFGELLSPTDRQKFRDALQLAFSLDDRRAHRDRGSYFKDKATEIGGILGDMPWVLEVLHKVVDRVLRTAEVTYTHMGTDYLEAVFLPSEQSSLSPRQVVVQGKDAQNLYWLQLQRIGEGPRVVSDLASICQSSSSSPEAQVLVLRMLLKRGLVTGSHSLRGPLTLEISDKGRTALMGRDFGA